MIFRFWLSLLLVSLLLAESGTVLAAQRVDNFVLLDHSGKSQELYYQRDADAIVIMIHGNGCQIVRSILPDYKALQAEYESRGIRFFMLNSNLQDTRKSIAAEAAEWGIELPILHDSAQIVGPSLALTRTAEVLVIDPESWEIVYRGALNDRVFYERQKKQAGKHYVRDVLDALLAGESSPLSKIESAGCIINFPDQDQGGSISYSETIAPLLIEKCVSCHRQGGIAPWAMSEYRMVQGFAPMMREVIRTRRMPPWHVDPAIGRWQHDGGLSDSEIRSLVSWIEAGAPRGEGGDPLEAVPQKRDQWTLGEPDLVLDVPAFDVPATGVVDYQYPVISNPLDRDVWVVAAAVIPGDSQAVHHLLMGSADEVPAMDDNESVFQNYIIGYAPGNESAHMPKGTGVFVPVGGVYLLQMHYTPYGKSSTDRTRVGLYLSDTAPGNYLHQQVIVNPRLQIPPHAAAHEERAYFEFWDDATLYSLTPHSHYRGRSSSFELVYADGNTELVLSVPDYDFNWQRTYNFREPKSVPAGTRIIHRTIYDNSSLNPGNPDPERTVPWGLQSEDEMLYGSISYSWNKETTAAPTHSRLTSETAQWMGYLDRDMDGLVSSEEMPKRLRKSIGWKWRLLDADSDEGLNLAELEVLMKRLMESDDS